MNIKPTLSTMLAHMMGVLLLVWSPVLLAQTQPPATQQAQKKMMTIEVNVSFDKGTADVDRESIPVFLRAARVKGPFEPTDPKPTAEWTALTDASGKATFSDVPADLATKGLRLQAVASWDDSLFKTPQYVPASGLRIDVPIYERGFDPNTLRVESIHMVVEPWEDYLVYTQLWTIGVEGDQAFDTSLVSHPDYKDGIPIELPLKASGIKEFNPLSQQWSRMVGSKVYWMGMLELNGANLHIKLPHKIVNSTVYWKGVIRPGKPITFQLRFSMPVKDESYVYEQPLDYKTQKLELIIPLETMYRNKLPRLNGLGLLAPGFNADDIRSGFNLPGLPPNREFIHARRTDLPADAGIKFKLTNLPYARPIGPWIALLIGVLGILVVMIFAQRERRAIAQGKRQSSTITLLEAELEELFGELQELDRDVNAGHIAEALYEREVIAIKARIGLILKKLDELEPSASTATT